MIRISPSKYHVTYHPHPPPYKIQTLETMTGINKKASKLDEKEKCWKIPPVISIVGISRVRDDTLWLGGRIFWFLAVLVCLGLCVWQLYNCTQSYFSESVIQNVDIVRNSTVTFPAVFICPGFTRNVQSSLTQKNIEKCGDENFLECFQDPYLKLTASEKVEKLKNLGNADNMWKYFGLNESMIRVYKPCSVNDDNCNQDGREWDVSKKPVDTFWGRCLALNTVREEDYRGPFTYFSIEYTDMEHIRKVEALQKMNLSSFDDTLLKSINDSLERHRIGLMFHLHNEYADGEQHRMFFSIQDALQGFNTNVELRKQTFVTESRRRYPCVSEKRYKDCTNDCFEKALSKDCRMPYAQSNSNSKSCSISKLFKIHVANYEAYSSFNQSDCKCLPSCTDIKYAVSIDVIDKIKDDYNSHVKIKFYFPDNTYDVTTEKLAYEATAYLSDVGGNLGFFLGFCVLNVLELIEFIMYLISKHKQM